jgi:predicted nucleic acid-binding protein
VHERGLADTSVLIELESIGATALPNELAVSAVSLGELAAGPHATDDGRERARRQDRLQRVQATFDPIPFDADAARAYGQIYAGVRSAGRKARGRRLADLMIAATALAARLPLYTPQRRRLFRPGRSPGSRARRSRGRLRAINCTAVAACRAERRTFFTHRGRTGAAEERSRRCVHAAAIRGCAGGRYRSSRP